MRVITIPNTIVACIPEELFVAAHTQVSTWRGRCLDAFTRADAAVTTTLDAMASAGTRGLKVKRPHYRGQQLAALSEAIASSGPFHHEGCFAAALLQRFCELNDFRNMLCHGTTRISLDDQGHWITIFDLNTFEDGHLISRRSIWCESEADVHAREMALTCHRFSGQLGTVRSNIAKALGAAAAAATAS